MQAFSCYNEATKNAPALLATAGSAAELVTGIKENKSDMPKSSTPVSTPTNNRRKRALALIGQRFRMLTVIGLGKPGSVQVRCDCGVIREYETYELKSGGRQSCGCLKA